MLVNVYRAYQDYAYHTNLQIKMNNSTEFDLRHEDRQDRLHMHHIHQIKELLLHKCKRCKIKLLCFTNNMQLPVGLLKT